MIQEILQRLPSVLEISLVDKVDLLTDAVEVVNAILTVCVI